ncbi:rhomboid family intramembrane serine protease [Halobacillus salinarum]|uniref:Rhomboid family intramembrane serine protease n=1 Tax=Halobacillus salinarum TaxID=2932257 RepID=A0ABY4EL31_9BACI|nr:rhomboid family intramembrane serine protease [Halobacillus salinarum]UOQ44354.1 rhomboid family intramembrane serine protease [Halobacillus salinarum]
MFVRTESFKEFIRFYPIVSALVIIHFVLWLLISVLHFGFAVQLYQQGLGVNLLISQGEYWRLITPVFLHAGFAHALFNSFSLVLFGPALEQMLGKTKFILLYLFAGFAGNLGTYIASPESYTAHLGASGAIFGLFGVYIFMVFFRKHLIDQANAQIITVIFILGAVMTFLQANINVLGHIFGFLGGLAAAPIVLRNVQGFSLSQIRSRSSSPGGFSFNPNRHSRRNRSLKTAGRYLFWGLIIFLVAIYVFSNFL